MEGELAVCCSEAEPEQLSLPVLIPGASGTHSGSKAVAKSLLRYLYLPLAPNMTFSLTIDTQIKFATRELLSDVFHQGMRSTS
ncbi:MAG: hypothetical protein GX825_08865 [Syntrophomonadaceae bacterium]|nr:hypothetical protein [Syntrophomonadaceae bacterium]